MKTLYLMLYHVTSSIGWISNTFNPIFCTSTGTIWFPNQSNSQRNRFLADQLAAESARKGAVVEATNSKQALSWSRFTTYLQSIGIFDPYLTTFPKDHQHRILGAFGQVIRESRFHTKQHHPCKSESVRAAMDHVAQAYRLANRPDPRLDIDGKPAFILQWQLKGYKNTDPPEKQQVAITASVLREFYKLSLSTIDKAQCELFIGAFFFAMRSYEYLKVSGTRKTKILCLRNIRFFKGKRLLKHSDPLLHLADTISITFEYQKWDIKNDIITHHKTVDPLLCPVKIWSRIIRRITAYPSLGPTTMVNTFISKDNKTHLFPDLNFFLG
jgi:hypothetical protein